MSNRPEILAAYRRLAIAIVNEAAMDYIRPMERTHKISAIKFFWTEWFLFLAISLDIDSMTLFRRLEQLRCEFYQQDDIEGVDLKSWLRMRVT